MIIVLKRTADTLLLIKKGMDYKIKFLLSIFLVCHAMAALAQESDNLIPHLEKRAKAVQLMVEGRPYLILGGELHNSSSSSLAYLEPFWPELAQAHLNTVLAAVSWELIEPREGKFDFHLVDGMIEQARKNNLHLVLLWFGSWKNSASTYAPIWVKKDQKRFPLVINKNGARLDILSPLSRLTLMADANAFAHLMAHIKKIDGQKHTVIMMQVENEVGILGDSRDRSKLADEVFAKDVPAQLIHYLQDNKNNLRKDIYQLWKSQDFKTSGNWNDIFGKGNSADEIFMAWQYANFINRVAQAGKAEYPLPMYVNAWIVQPKDKAPGDYPSGGPQAHIHDIWKAAAPNIDLLVPDIYLPMFRENADKYKEEDKAFFVPESFAGEKGAANAFYAVGACNGLGYSPFGIEDFVKDSANEPIAKAYDVLGQLAPLILKAQADGTIAAVLLNKQHPEQKVRLGDYVLDVEPRHTWETMGTTDKGYALIIVTAPNEYYIAGNDFQITFFPAKGSELVGFDYVEEGTFKQGKWQPGRRLNGDAISNSIRFSDMAAKGKTGNVLRIADGPAIRKVKVYTF